MYLKQVHGTDLVLIDSKTAQASVADACVTVLPHQACTIMVADCLPVIFCTSDGQVLAAAHAGCFSMKLSFVLGAAGFTPEKIDTKCEITFVDGTLSKSHLIVSASVPGIDDAKFQECVKDAEQNCPISKLLGKGLEISSTATLSA